MGYSLPIIRNHSRKVRPAKTWTFTRHLLRGTSNLSGEGKARVAPRETRAGKRGPHTLPMEIGLWSTSCTWTNVFKSGVNGDD